MNAFGILDDHLPDMNKIEYRYYYELYEKKKSAFKDWVDVDQACLNCKFPNLINHANPKYYIKMYEDGLDPYEIPTQDELEAEWDLFD
jgi:hypothetical protein